MLLVTECRYELDRWFVYIRTRADCSQEAVDVEASLTFLETALVAAAHVYVYSLTD